MRIFKGGRRFLVAGLATVAFAGLVAGASAFGTGGKVLVNVGGVNSAKAIARDSQGRLLLIGSTTNADFDFAVTRLLPSGVPDSGFAGGGTVETDLSGFDATDGGATTGNKVLLAGASEPVDDFQATLLQYDSGGTLDMGFSGDGVVQLSFPGGSVFRDVAVQRDGKIVAAGTAGNKLLVARFKANGKPDRRFSKDGVAKLGLKAFTGADTVAVQRDGKVVVAGDTNGASMSSKQFTIVARFTSEGRLDTHFGKRGVRKVTKGFPAISDIAVTKKGVIYGAGTYRSKRLADGHLAAFSLTARGSLNRRFSKDGIAGTSLGEDSSGAAVAVQRDGRILAGGNIHQSDGDWLLTRFTRKGKLDKSFSGDGVVTTDLGGTTDFMQSAITFGKGRIAAAGGGASQTAAAVYKRNGSLDG